MSDNVNFLQSCLLKYRSQYSFICGDFNARLDSKDGTPANILKSFLVRNNLINSFRKMYNSDTSKFHGFTFPGNPSQNPSCIDYIFCSGLLSDSISKISNLNPTLANSDHSILSASFFLQK